MIMVLQVLPSSEVMTGRETNAHFLSKITTFVQIHTGLSSHMTASQFTRIHSDPSCGR